MNSKYRKILIAPFAEPASSSIVWKDIENLFVACGAEISEGRGLRVRVPLKGILATFHRPHPQPITDKRAVKSARRFLENAGVKP